MNCFVNHPHVEFDHIYSYEEFLECVYCLGELYSELIHIKSIGKTYCNRKIPMLILGNGKNPLLFTAGVHGRETINTTVWLAMVETYARGFQYGATVCGMNMRKIFSEFTFYIIPLVNPDGYEIARTKGKEMWKGNGRNVDLNRNFPSIHWKPKNVFDYPASERETRALIRIMNCTPALAYIDYHSRGKSVFYYRSSMDEIYNKNQKRIGECLARACHYKLEEPNQEIEQDDTGGNTVHYFSEIRKAPSFTIETTEEQETFPLSSKLLKETFMEILPTPLILTRII